MLPKFSSVRINFRAANNIKNAGQGRNITSDKFCMLHQILLSQVTIHGANYTMNRTLKGIPTRQALQGKLPYSGSHSTGKKFSPQTYGPYLTSNTIYSLKQPTHECYIRGTHVRLQFPNISQEVSLIASLIAFSNEHRPCRHSKISYNFSATEHRRNKPKAPFETIIWCSTFISNLSIEPSNALTQTSKIQKFSTFFHQALYKLIHIRIHI